VCVCVHNMALAGLVSHVGAAVRPHLLAPVVDLSISSFISCGSLGFGRRHTCRCRRRDADMTASPPHVHAFGCQVIPVTEKCELCNRPLMFCFPCYANLPRPTLIEQLRTAASNAIRVDQHCLISHTILILSSLVKSSQVGHGGWVHPKFWLSRPRCIWPTQQLACMFVSCSSVKLVQQKIYLAVTAFCVFCDKLPADQIFSGISKSYPLSLYIVTANCLGFLLTYSLVSKMT